MTPVPSVGRVVHFFSGKGDPQAAIITKVWSDTLVNLAVFDEMGTTNGRTSIYFGKDAAPLGSVYADWPERI